MEGLGQHHLLDRGAGAGRGCRPKGRSVTGGQQRTVQRCGQQGTHLRFFSKFISSGCSPGTLRPRDRRTRSGNRTGHFLPFRSERRFQCEGDLVDRRKGSGTEQPPRASGGGRKERSQRRRSGPAVPPPKVAPQPCGPPVPERVQGLLGLLVVVLPHSDSLAVPQGSGLLLGPGLRGRGRGAQGDLVRLLLQQSGGQRDRRRLQANAMAAEAVQSLLVVEVHHDDGLHLGFLLSLTQTQTLTLTSRGLRGSRSSFRLIFLREASSARLPPHRFGGLGIR